MMNHNEVSGDQVQAAGILLVSGRPGQMPQQFLLMRHPDRWDLPKGHAEPNETLVETALRETAEEAAIEPDQITLDADFCFQLTYPVSYRETGSRVFHKTVSYFLGYLPQPVSVRCSEHSSSRWFDWSPPHRIQAQTIDPLLAAVEQHLKGNQLPS